MRLLRACLIGLALLVIPVTAQADKMVGYIKPLPEELLANPIYLSCGATIREWRGSRIDIEYVDQLCSLALNSFRPFVENEGWSVPEKGPFSFDVALLPDTTAYRGLNDTRWRFAYRATQNEVWGYTSHTNSYIFITSDTKSPEFASTFVHELFHAMSLYFGLFETFPGTMNQQFEQDEILARKFEAIARQ